MALFARPCDTLGGGQDEQKPLSNLKARVAELDTLWASRKYVQYYDQLAAVTNDIQSVPRSRELQDVVIGLLDSIVSKDFNASQVATRDLPDISISDLDALEVLSSYLLSNDRMTPERARSHLLLLARCLGRIRREVVPNYVDREVQPASSTSATKDASEARKNDENRILNARQHSLQQLNRSLGRRVLARIIKTVKEERKDSRLLAECIKEAGLTEEEKQQLIRRIDPPSLEVQVSQIEDLWKAGKHTAYFSELYDVTREIDSVRQKRDVSSAAVALLESVLAKEPSISETPTEDLTEICTSDLSAMGRMVYCVQCRKDRSMKERQANALLLAKCLGRIRKELIPNFERKQTVMNVAPPSGGFGFPGMAPDAIDDPARRAKYIADIRQNVINTVVNSRQNELYRLNRSTAAFILDEIIEAFQDADSSAPLLKECIREGRLTNEEIQQVLNKTKGAKGVGVEWQGLNQSHTIHKLTNPVGAGTVTIRGRAQSATLRPLLAIAGMLPSKNKLSVAYDDHGSLGRFCDRDAPFHALIHEGNLTPHHEWCLHNRFPPNTPQPEAAPIGQLRVVWVVNSTNSIRAIDFAGIRKAINEKGKTLSWRDIGGTGSAGIECFGSPETSWARQVLLERCMTRLRDTDNPAVREVQQVGFRDDLTVCTDAKEAITKVRSNRHALGFFACSEPLSKQDLHGVRVMAVSEGEGKPAIAPPLDLDYDPAYPMAEPLTLYIHPNAPPEAHEFGKFAQGPEAAKILQRFGIWPEYLAIEAKRQERVNLVKAGKGTPITVYSLMGRKGLLQDLATKFVEDKAAVQLKVEKKGDWDAAFTKYSQGEIDFFLTDETATEDEMTTKDTKNTKTGNQQNVKAAPTRVELGQMAVGVIVHPENLLDSLPLDELRSIFTGEIKAWPGMKGAVATMHLVGLDPQSPLTLLFKEKLAATSPSTATSGDTSTGRSAADLAKYTVKNDTEQVILTVARDPSAIGFVDLSRVPKDEKSVKVIPVFARKDKTARMPKEIQNPLTRTLLLYASPRASQTAKDFATFVSSADCAELLAQHGLVSPARRAEIAKRKPELPDLKEFAKRNRPAKKTDDDKGNAVAAVPALNLPDPDQDDAKPKAKSVQNANAPVALPDLAPPPSEPWRTALENTPAANPSSPPFGAPKRPVDSPKKSSRSSGSESANPASASGSPAIALFAIAGAAGLVIAMFAWFGSVQRKRKKR